MPGFLPDNTLCLTHPLPENELTLAVINHEQSLMSETAPHCLYGHHHSIDFSCCFHRENNKELKAGKRLTEKALEALSKEALRQIDEKNYETEQRAHGAEHILKIGIAFSDKNVKVTTNHSF